MEFEGQSSLFYFELARRTLGHAAVIPLELAEELGQKLEQSTEEDHTAVLVEYALALKRAQKEKTRGDGIRPVLPRVDISNGEIEHISSTGNTRLWMVRTNRSGGGFVPHRRWYFKPSREEECLSLAETRPELQYLIDLQFVYYKNSTLLKLDADQRRWAEDELLCAAGLKTREEEQP